MAVRMLVLVLMLLASTSALAADQYGSFNRLRTFDVPLAETFWQDYSGIEGFCYGGGYLWLQTWIGYLVQVDTTTEEVINAAKITIENAYDSFYGALYYENDTLWTVWKRDIYPLDTSGNVIGPEIDFSAVGDPLLGDIGGIVKQGNNFWLSEKWTPGIFKVDRNGNVTTQYLNAWYDFWSPNIALVGNKILKKTDSTSPTNDWDYDAVIGLDLDTGLITDMWDFPSVMMESGTPLGLSAGDNCLWITKVQGQGENQWLSVQKLALPDPSPTPDMNTSDYGDFTIVDWRYCPIKASQIEGLYGLEYDAANQQIWIGNGIAHLYRVNDSGDRGFSDITRWIEWPYIHYDIAVVRDSLWVAQFWRGLTEPEILQIELDGTDIVINRRFDAFMDQVAGIASDGNYLWVSGRDSTVSTGQRNNDIKKFDFSGNLIAEFHYPDDNYHNYEDLTWHQDYLWAFSRTFDGWASSEIHVLDPNTGEVLHQYQTGWIDPSDNVEGTLASDGTNLLTIGTVSTGVWDSYENDHVRVLLLQPKATDVISTEAPLPQDFGLAQNYPNPFNPVTTITYDVKNGSRVVLKVFDVRGREIQTLVDEYKQAGEYKVMFDGRSLPSGVYFYQIHMKDFTAVRKMILLE